MSIFKTIISWLCHLPVADYVIELATTAMGICPESDTDKTTLCYILFSHHLKLGHNDAAYDSMVSNPDQSRRKDSLRQVRKANMYQNLT